MAERTIVVFKPDSVERGLVGEILSRFERAGLRIVGSKTLTVTEEFVSHHYPDKTDFLRSMGVKSLENYAEAGLDPFKEIGTYDPVEIGRNIRKWSMEFLSRGPVIAFVLEGNNAAEKVQLAGINNLAQNAPVDRNQVADFEPVEIGFLFQPASDRPKGGLPQP